MATIAFLMDDEEGHLLPSFVLAHSLREEGHRIIYISMPDNEDLVRNEGFEFQPFFADIYPKGFKKILRHNGNVQGQVSPDISSCQQKHVSELRSGRFSTFLQSLNADLFVISSYLFIEALLVHYRLGVQPVMYSPGIWGYQKKLSTACSDSLMTMNGEQVYQLVDFVEQLGYRFDSMAGITAPLDSFPHLVACPRELLLAGAQPFKSNAVSCIGPCVNREKDPGVSYFPEAAGKKIIYASLGSQAEAYIGKNTSFYNIMLDLIRQPFMQGYHLVLNVGRDMQGDFAQQQNPSVTVVRWISQVDVIRQASLVINHGGLGTVKECIYYGVAMILVPMGRDQPEAGKLVEHHGLGRMILPQELTLEKLSSAIADILNDPGYTERLERMKQVFRSSESSGLANRIIAAALKKQRDGVQKHADKPVRIRI